MSCLSDERKTELEAKKVKLENIIAAIEDSILEGATTAFFSNTELDTGEAKQKISFRNIAEMQRGLRLFEANLARVCVILEGKGIVDFGLYRRG